MKPCSKCKVVKSLEDFVNDYRLKSGKGSQCKTCRSVYTKRRWNQGLMKKTEAQKAHTRKYSSQWSKRNRDKKRAAYKKWSAANREKDRARGHNRRLAIKAVSYKLETKELKKLYQQSCFVCKSASKIEIDHIIPLAKGGNHSIGNLLPLCRNCNAKKSDKPLVYLRYKKQPEVKET